jgi:hypothetical protein
LLTAILDEPALALTAVLTAVTDHCFSRLLSAAGCFTDLVFKQKAVTTLQSRDLRRLHPVMLRYRSVELSE